MEKDKLAKVLDKHRAWMRGDDGGEKADLSRANLSWSNLSDANLSGSNLSWSNLSDANLSGSNLSDADLSRANLRGTNLSGTDLSSANLSDATGLISPIDYMRGNFERVDGGYVAYKTFGAQYRAPEYWGIKPGYVISETVNANRTDPCGCGINVAPLPWVQSHHKGPIWRVLIRWEWLPGVVVPYGTDGKIRCEKVELMEVVADDPS
ncbi:MAG: pentapeptide repeat-containing protein [Oscillospiraceae bacterium]|nr:pentapeptide repeat-containing protein [Oscillospiraceae bacterium]